MPIQNADIAAVFAEIADRLEIKGGENPFRVRAYRNAARIAGDAPAPLRDLVAAGSDLEALEGIGPDLAKKIAEIVATGACRALEDLRREMPAGLADLLRLPGLGPKRVRALWKELGVETADQLGAAARAGRVRDLAGFGEKLEAQLLAAVAARAAAGRRFRRAAVEPAVEALLALLRPIPGVEAAEAAGSYRRFRDTVGDVDLLAASDAPGPVMERFAAGDDVERVLARGDTKSSVILRGGIQADLRVVPPASYGAALQYFTGSQAHNIALRRIAQQAGLKLNEYGVFRGEASVAGRTEAEVYAALGLPWIPPELREDRGEIDAAREGRLPALVGVEDLRGDLHAHTDWSDGEATIEAMAEAARARGYAYLAITDHSKRLTVANGLDEDRLRRQIDAIDRVNEGLKGFRVLKGTEVDILEDGSLDFSDEVLGRLDLVVGSVHSKFNLSGEQQTARILRAMDRPHFSILGHPTGRLLPDRPPYDVDIPRIVAHAKQRGCFLELNANPHRLDLHDVHCQAAREAGVLVSIDTDAHAPRELDHARHGIGQARRGGLRAGDVLNARPLRSLMALLRRTMNP